MAGLAATPVEVWVVRVQLVGGVVGAVACSRFLGLQLALGTNTWAYYGRAYFAGKCANPMETTETGTPLGM